MVITEINADSLVTLFITVLAPLLVGLVTKASWPQSLKSILLLTTSTAIGVAQGFLQAPDGATWNWQLALANGVIAWVIAVATYYGLWKPTGVADKAQASLVKDGNVDVAARLDG